MFEPKTVRPLVGSALSESSKVKLSLAMELVVRPVFLSWEVLDFEKHHTSFFINCDGCDYGVLVSSCLVWYEWISTGTFRHVLLGAFSTRGYGFDRHGGFGGSTGLGWSTKATGVSDGGGCRHGGQIWSSQDTQISRCFYCFILIHNQHKMIQHWVCKPNFCINMCAVAIRLNWAIAFMAFAEWYILGKEFLKLVWNGFSQAGVNSLSSASSGGHEDGCHQIYHVSWYEFGHGASCQQLQPRYGMNERVSCGSVFQCFKWWEMLQSGHVFTHLSTRHRKKSSCLGVLCHLLVVFADKSLRISMV